MKRFVISKSFTNIGTDSLNQYLKDIAEIELFTPQQELACLEKISKGDEKAVDELVMRNLRFVVSVAKQYATPQNPLEDLINEGNIGLILAVKKFDVKTGYKFISYAVWWVRKIIIEHLAKNGRLVKLPANKLTNLLKLNKQINELEQRLGRSVSIEDIIDEFGPSLGLDLTNKDEVNKFAKDYELLEVLNNYNMDSLDRDISGDETSNSSLAETLSDNMFNSTDHELIDESVKYDLNKVLDILKPRDKQIMIGLYGLDGEAPRTLNSIASDWDITREMVRQIKEKSLVKLRNKLTEHSMNLA